MTLKEVYINKEAYSMMEKHAYHGAPGEIGGFLLGRPCIIGDDSVTWVMKAVPGNCVLSRGHVVIKSTTYDRAWTEMEQDELIIVGWYHTHPGMGIFLSGTDVTAMYTAPAAKLAVAPISPCSPMPPAHDRHTRISLLSSADLKPACAD